MIGDRRVGIYVAAVALFGCGSRHTAWSSGPPMPYPRTELQVAALGTRLFVLGGFPKSSNARVDVFDADTRSWSLAAPLPAGGDHIAVAAGSGHIYVFGGNHADDETDDAFSYDLASNRWSRLPPLPARCAAGAAAVLGQEVHIVGGACKLSPTEYPDVDRHWVFDPANNTYREAAVIPLAREHFALIPADGKLYAIAGRHDVKTDELADVEVYDPATDRWRQLAPLPEKRSGYAATYVHGAIMVFGGDNGTEQHQAPSHVEVFVYDLRANVWSRGGMLPYGVHGTGAVVLNGRVYMPGGSSMGGHDFPLASMLVLEPQ